MTNSSRRFLVSPPSYDNIGQVLTAMGEGFAHQQIDPASISKPGALDGCEVLFLNCGSVSANHAMNSAIQQFVVRGGSLYASDWAGSVIESAFPGALSFDKSGPSAHAKCNVTDGGLREIIGNNINIHFNLPGWYKVSAYRSDARAYVEWPGKGQGGRPLPIVVTFSHGDGHVIYTSFHNEANLSETEQKLLRFLVLRPIMARAAAGAGAAVQARLFVPDKEVIDTIPSSKRAGPYTFTSNGGDTILHMLQWEGTGTLRLTVQDPSGAVVSQSDSSQPPIQHEAYSPQSGSWTCYVEALSVPYANFPFVLTSGKRTEVAAPSKRPAASRHPNPYTKQWGSAHPGCLIILLDQSESMKNLFGGSQIGSGKRKADMVATALNGLLYELIRTNTVGADIKPRIDLAVLGYSGGNARSVLGGALAGKNFVSLPELLVNPMRVEIRMRKEVDDDNNVVEIPTTFPIWVEPVAKDGSATPMCSALARARELAESWSNSHPDNYPPVIINITDGESTDGDPTYAASLIRQVGTDDGEALLFNCYITDIATASPIEFPVNSSALPTPLANLLYSISSELPEPARHSIRGATGRDLPPGSRGLIFNGDAGSVRLMFTFATVAAMPALDPTK